MCYNKLVITLIRLGNRNNAVKERKLHMLLNYSDSRHRRFKRLGMCFANEPGDGGAGGTGGGSATDPNNKENQDNGKDAKFTQDDVNKILSEDLQKKKLKKTKSLQT